MNSSYVHTNPAIRGIRRAIAAAFPSAGVTLIERTINDKPETLIRLLYESGCRIFGFSVYIWNKAEMMSCASAIKLLIPDAFIFFGGPEMCGQKEAGLPVMKECPAVGAVVEGEGEISVCTLLNDLFKGKADTWYFTPDSSDAFDGSCVYNPEEDLSGRIVYYESSRGCPFSCSFCLSSVKNGNKSVRAVDPEKVMNEIRPLKNRGIRVLKFIDRTFNFDKKRAARLADAIIKENFDFPVQFEFCARLVDDEMLSVLSEVPPGKIQLEAGLQSADPEVLSAVGRFPDANTEAEAIYRLSEIKNIHLHCDLIAGLPMETYASFRMAFDLLYGHCDMLQLGFLKLLPGTPLRTQAEKFGIKYRSDPPYTVLETASMSFNELCALRGIETLVSRYGSGTTSEIIKGISENSSAFDFYEGFYRFLISRTPEADSLSGGVSTRRAFSELRDYLIFYGVDEEKLRPVLRLAFLLTDTGALPDFLLPEENEKLTKEEAGRYRALIPEERNAYLYIGKFGSSCAAVFRLQKTVRVYNEKESVFNSEMSINNPDIQNLFTININIVH